LTRAVTVSDHHLERREAPAEARGMTGHAGRARSAAFRASGLALSLCAGLSWAGAVHAQCEVQAFTDTEPDNSLGASVAICADVAVIGRAHPAPGEAKVLRRQGMTWVLEAELSETVEGCNNVLGGSSAISGNVIVIGDFESCAGVAYVYRYDGRGWPLEAVLSASDGALGDRFGRSVAIDGDTILVGADFNDNVQGAAYVFRYDGRTWVEEAKLTDPNGQGGDEVPAGDGLGHAVALDGDVAIAGGPGNNIFHGAAFAFRRFGTRWVFEQEIQPWDNPTFQVRFGWSVAVIGETVAVGAPFDIGSVYLFEHDGAGWQPQVKLQGSLPIGIGPLFGSKLSLGEQADVLLIGATRDSQAGGEAGAAYLFRRQPGWTEVAKFVAADTNAADQFGAVGLSGDYGVIGAPGNNSSGKAYIFAGLSGSDCNGNAEPDGCEIFDGSAVDEDDNGVPDECEVEGDVNGDGVVDVLDLVEIILTWGPCAPPCPPACAADTTGDCSVEVADMSLTLLNWGAGG
jgi:hypothetical protein